MNGPHAVLVDDGPDHRPETGRTQFAALPLNFTAIRQALPLDSTPRGYKTSRKSPLANKKSSGRVRTARRSCRPIFSARSKAIPEPGRVQERGGEGAEGMR